METFQVIILIFQILLTLVFTLGGFIIKGIQKRVELLEGSVKAMQLNYLDRFTAVLKNQGDVKLDLVEQQNRVKEELLTQQHLIKEELANHNNITKDELLNAIHCLELKVVSNK